MPERYIDTSCVMFTNNNSILSFDCYVIKLKSVHALLLFADDPKECELVDCTKDLAVDLCPKTCSPKNELTKESEICKLVDCSKLKSSQLCPVTCAASTKGNHFCRTINI